MTTIPKCFRCVHFHDDNTYTCDAFPEGIPDDILESEFDHREPHEGDAGVTFREKSGDGVDRGPEES